MEVEIVTTYTTKVQVLNALKNQIKSKPDQAKKALLQIYKKQTLEERSSRGTRDLNNEGFTSFDSAFLSSLAEQLKSRGTLSEKQTIYLQKIMPKYARQILEDLIASGKIVKKGKFYAFVKEA